MNVKKNKNPIHFGRLMIRDKIRGGSLHLFVLFINPRALTNEDDDDNDEDDVKLSRVEFRSSGIVANYKSQADSKAR